MDEVLNLSNQELLDMGVNKLKHRRLITEETQKLRKEAKEKAEKLKKEAEEKAQADEIAKAEKFVLNSTGAGTGVAFNKGHMLGQFHYLEDKKCFVQSSTEQSHKDFQARYMYQNTDNCWWVNGTPGKEAGWLKNPRTNNEGLPENGHWQYADRSKPIIQGTTVTFMRFFQQSVYDLFPSARFSGNRDLYA